MDSHLNGDSAAEVGEKASLGVCGPSSVQMPYDDCNSHNGDKDDENIHASSPSADI